MTSISYEAVRANYPRKKDISGADLYAQHRSSGVCRQPLHGKYLRRSGKPGTAGCRRENHPGPHGIKAGKFKGKQLEQGQKRLSDFMTRKFGKPEVYKSGNAARAGIGQRRGVISFFQLLGPTDTQGHIDLVAPDEWNALLCAGVCYWSAVEFWFWPLK